MIPEYIKTEYRKKGDEMLWFGEPVNSLSKDDLIALVAWMGEHPMYIKRPKRQGVLISE